MILSPPLHLIKYAKNIRLLILDIDGVLTDGKLYLSSTGDETIAFHIHDGMGINILQKAGVEIAIISGRNNKPAQIRLKNLGISHCYLGQEDKVVAYQHIQSTLDIPSTQIAYAGDDINDIPVMQQVHFPIAVANALPAVKKIAVWETERAGGHGAVREICDLIYSAKTS